MRTTSGGWDLRQDAEGPRSGFGCTFRGVMGQANTAGQPGLDWGGAVVSPPQVLGGLHPNATWTPPPPAPWQGQHVRLPPGQHSAGRGKAGEWGGCWYSLGGPSCAQHMSPGSPRPSPRARGWEQLATGRPLNKEPLSSVRACPARSGQLTLPGMPRLAPSVAYRVPRGGGTAGPGALGSVWGAPAPTTGTPPGQGRAARAPS